MVPVLQSMVDDSEIGGDADVGKLRSMIVEVQTDTHLLKGEQEELRLQQSKLVKDVSRLKTAGTSEGNMKPLWFWSAGLFSISEEFK